MWILESPAAHLAVAALGPVAERKEKIDFSVQQQFVLCVTRDRPRVRAVYVRVGTVNF